MAMPDAGVPGWVGRGVNRVEDVVQVGQTVEAWVRRVQDDRVELTMVEPLGLEWRELKPEMQPALSIPAAVDTPFARAWHPQESP